MTDLGGKVLLTGSTGFVGKHLVPDLQAAGYTVIQPTRVEIGEIDGNTDWHPYLDDIDTVIHLANRAHVMNETSENPIDIYREVNLHGTENLARQAAEKGARRFIYLSSVKTMGEESQHPLSADDELAPCDPYGVSKAEAEEALLRYAGRMEIVILRPPLVYGPQVKGNFIALLRLLTRGLPLPVGAIKNRRSMIYVKNLTHAISHAIHCLPGIYLPSDQHDLSTPELFRLTAKALGYPARLLPVPVAALKMAGRLSGRSNMIQRLTESLTVDGKIPGWMPIYSPEEGLKETADWYRGHRQDIS
ncbi:NAD-dependent epimerase/dehydratase family protein [Aestuariispira insulae]|nr:NAD-dependent epimerase/dehydratase family protein [Aestuariispira insulae]